MKNILVAGSLFRVIVFVLALVAPIAGLVSLRFLDVAGFIGAFAAAGLLAFALCDYSRKPSFCGRRIRRAASPTQPISNRPPAMVKPDWTYQTISP